MEKVKTVVLEDKKSYVILDEIAQNDVTYVYLILEEDIANFCIRKISKENDKTLLVSLNGKEEFDKALTAYFNKHRTDNDNAEKK